ncbi:MAG: hypothetical protein H7832_11225 [Magnetococcus sp. DMHC-6]
MLEWIFHLFNHPWMPWLFSLALFIWAAWQWSAFKVRFLTPIHKGISDALLHLHGHGGYQAFSEEFKRIDFELNQNPITEPAWNQFRKTLHPSDKGSLVYGTEKPESYFHLMGLITPPEDLRYHRYARSMPTYLVRIGLGFTFIGLIGAIYFATREIQAQDIYSSGEALQGLLRMAFFKFMASFSGILAAIIYSWRVKRHEFLIKKLLDQMCDLLNDGILQKTGEETLMEFTPPPQPGLSTDSTDLSLGIPSYDPLHVDHKFNQFADQLEQTMTHLNQKTAQTITDNLTPLVEQENISLQLTKTSTALEQIVTLLSDIQKTLTPAQAPLFLGVDGEERLAVNERLESIYQALVTNHAQLTQHLNQIRPDAPTEMTAAMASPMDLLATVRDSIQAETALLRQEFLEISTQHAHSQESVYQALAANHAQITQHLTQIRPDTPIEMTAAMASPMDLLFWRFLPNTPPFPKRVV